jgi:hypothetical protein
MKLAGRCSARIVHSAPARSAVARNRRDSERPEATEMVAFNRGPCASTHFSLESIDLVVRARTTLG